MIVLYNKWFLEKINAIGLSTFVFIILHPRLKDRPYWHDRVLNHEKIHYEQQKELLFVIDWVLYAYFYIKARVKGMNHKEAYRSNPFEMEANDNEDNFSYISKRKNIAGGSTYED